jgi:hypothetical protein
VCTIARNGIQQADLSHNGSAKYSQKISFFHSKFLCHIFVRDFVLVFGRFTLVFCMFAAAVEF